MIKIFTSVEELYPFRVQWNELAEKCGNPLLAYDWINEAAKAFYEVGSHYVVAKFCPDGKLVALLPLASRREKKRHGWLEIIGSSVLAEPAGVLYCALEDLIDVIDEVRFRLKVPVVLQRVPREIIEAASLSGFSIKGSITISRSSADSKYVETDVGLEKIESLMSGKRRYDLRRAAKRAKTRGEVSCHVVVPDEEELDSYLREAIRIEAACWKGHQNSSLQDNVKMHGFFCDYLKVAAKKRKVVIGFLKINDRNIAMQIALREFSALWALKIGYDEEYKKCSPGLLLTHEMIGYSTRNKIKRYEFLGSPEPWLNMWPVASHHYNTVVNYPLSINGLSAFSSDLIRIVYSRFLSTVARTK